MPHILGFCASQTSLCYAPTEGLCALCCSARLHVNSIGKMITVASPLLLRAHWCATVPIPYSVIGAVHPTVVSRHKENGMSSQAATAYHVFHSIISTTGSVGAHTICLCLFLVVRQCQERRC